MLAFLIHHLRTQGISATWSKVWRRLGFSGYQGWIGRNEGFWKRRPAPAEGPLFSLVVPVFNTPARFLRELAASVQAQTYRRWELILVNAASTRPGLADQLSSLNRSDKRIMVRTLSSNEGIAENTNAGLALATGAWVGFLDHDDTLAPFALQAVLETLVHRPDGEVFYSDEDKLTAWSGRRVLPFLKPDWSPETFLSYNYPCHFLVVNRILGERVGWLRTGFNGAQDYDFLLRLSEVAPLVHIPHVLYHWRMSEHSTAGRPDAKRYAYESAKRALGDHLQRTKSRGVVEDGLSLGTYRIRYPLAHRPLVSIIIPNRDQPDLLRACLTSLLQKTDYREIEVLVAENRSSDPETFEVYREFCSDPRVRLCPWGADGDFNYAAINNDTVRRHATGELLLFLNNDVEATDSRWLGVLVEKASQPELGAVGAKLVYADGTLQHGGVVVGIAGFAGHPFKGSRREASGYYSVLVVERNVSAVTGACLLVRRSVFEEVGGFDAEFPLAANDVDFCLRVQRAGYRNLWTPYAVLVHHESKTRGYEDTPEKRARFERERALFQARWQEYLTVGDPCYHRGLTLKSEDWSLA